MTECYCGRYDNQRLQNKNPGITAGVLHFVMIA
jgi:hypothetical protein